MCAYTFTHTWVIVQQSEVWNYNANNPKYSISYLKQETNQSQEWLGIARNTQTIIVSQATESIEILVLETFWTPRCENDNNGQLIKWLLMGYFCIYDTALTERFSLSIHQHFKSNVLVNYLLHDIQAKKIRNTYIIDSYLE